MKYTTQEFAQKVDYEGGVGSAMFYFGPDISRDVDNQELIEAWREAYGALERVRKMIPEPDYT